MAIDFSKYKTYDDSKERGNDQSWRIIIESILGKDFDEIFERIINKETNDFGKFKDKKFEDFKNEYKSRKNNKSTSLSSCKTIYELKTKFRKQMMIHHPDKGGNEEIAKKIIAEYEKMSYKLSKIKL